MLCLLKNPVHVSYLHYDIKRGLRQAFLIKKQNFSGMYENPTRFALFFGGNRRKARIINCGN
ncbi:hypothetical protein D3Z48_00045 [Clostridiaceae bacterium]|nr:hypothetical protein [Clostridiaceae bacterium]